MERIRRSAFLFFYIAERPFLDIEGLFENRVALRKYPGLHAVSILRREVYPIQDDEFALLQSLSPEEWTTVATALEQNPGLTGDRLHELACKGLLLSDDGEGLLSELRRREDRLSADRWPLFDALYHFMTRRENANWNDPCREESFETRVTIEETVYDMVAQRGKPPPAFKETGALSNTVELSLVERHDGLYELLRRRKTTRVFDTKSAMGLDQLAAVLYYVFGCHGYLPLAKDVMVIKRTSPSAGCMHPTEVYPLILNVNGLQPGLYHYSVEHHALSRLEGLSCEQARDWAVEFSAGQFYAGRTHVLLIMTSRFYRTFWKYPGQAGAYGVLLMDAAHLSQTLYLVCAELGLGCFFTAAINAVNIAKRLPIDSDQEGALAICGCGIPSRPEANELDPRFLPYVPRTTRIQGGEPRNAV